MYCIETKKNPKFEKNRMVMPNDPVAKSGLANNRTSSRGCLRRSSTTANSTASTTPADMQPHTIGCVQPRIGASTTPNTNTATAAPMRTAPIQSSGVAVSSRDEEIVNVAMNSPSADAAKP
jgi:hypothetical protein